MAIQHANRGIAKKDLQLYYNREFSKSFRGEATTNLQRDIFKFLTIREISRKMLLFRTSYHWHSIPNSTSPTKYVLVLELGAFSKEMKITSSPLIWLKSFTVQV